MRGACASLTGRAKHVRGRLRPNPGLGDARSRSTTCSWHRAVTPADGPALPASREGVRSRHGAQAGGPWAVFPGILACGQRLPRRLLCLEPASQNKCACQNIGGSNRPRAHPAQRARARGRPDPATDKGPGQGGRCASLSHLAGGDKAARRAPRGAGGSKRGHPGRGTQGWGPLSGFPQLVS